MRRFSVRPRRAGAIRLLVLAGLSVLALTLTSSSFGSGQPRHGTTGQLPTSTRAARSRRPRHSSQAARSIHGRVSWGPLGTPASVIHYGGYLAAGLKAPSAESAALNWLAAHKAAFGLRSVKHLRVLTAAPLRGSKAHAVSFRQTFGGALSADGVVTVTVVPAKTGWKVVYASSSLARDQAVVGKRSLSPVHAWVKAANAAGIHVSDVAAPRQDRRRCDRHLGERPERLGDRATDRVRHGQEGRDPRLRHDRDEVDPRRQDSYRVIVDAATGKLLYRQNLVDNLADNPVWSALPDRAAVQPAERVPVELPEHGHAADTTAGPRRPAAPTSSRTTRRRRSTRCGVASKFQWDIPMDVAGIQGTPQSTVGNNVDEALLWSGGGRSYNNPANPRPISATRDYTAANYPFTNQWFNIAVQPGAADRDRTGRSPGEPERRGLVGCHDQPLRRPQPAARLRVLPRLGRGPLERPAVQQRHQHGRPVADAGRPYGHSGRQRRHHGPVAGRRDQRRSAWLRGPRQREHGHRRRRAAPVDQHVPLAAAAGCVLRPVRRRRLRRHRLRARVRPRDREPHDRQGRRRPAGHPRRRDGRGLRRLRRARVREREPHRTGPRLRPLHRGRLRHGQRLQRHPRLPRGPADGRRVPGSRARTRTPIR